MMAKVRVLFVALALWLAVGSPALVGWQARARPVEAQGALAAEIGALCVSDPLLAAACAGFVTMGLIVYITSGGPVPTQQQLMDLVPSLADKFFSGGAGVEQYKLQFQQHSFYALVTGEMLTDWSAAMGGLLQGGWSYEVDYEGLGVNVWRRAWGNEERLLLASEDFVMPSGSNCTDVTVEGGGAWNVKDAAGTADVGKWYFVHGDPEVESLLFSFNSRASSPEKYAVYGASPDCSIAGELGHMLLKLPDSAVAFPDEGDYYYLSSPTAIGLRVWVDGTDPAVYIGMTDMALAGVDYMSPEGQKVYLPLFADLLVGWNGVSPLPRADGTTGELVEVYPPTTPTDEEWWERSLGLLTGGLGGIRDWVEKVWERLGDISDTLENVWEWAQALPDNMVSALTAAVVPSESVQVRAEELGADLNLKMPFAWPGLVFAMMGDLFAGSTACPEFTIPVSDMGMASDIVFEACLPPDIKSVAYVIWDVVAVLVVAEWAWWAFRRVVGS